MPDITHLDVALIAWMHTTALSLYDEISVLLIRARSASWRATYPNNRVKRNVDSLVTGTQLVRDKARH